MRVSLAVCLALLVVVPAVQPPAANAAADYPLDDSDSEIQEAVEYLLDVLDSDGDIGGFVTSAWAVMALAAAEEEDAVADLIAYLEDEAGDYVGEYKATDWARMILAIVAAGEDPTDFGGKHYIDGLLDLREVENETGYDYNQIGDPELLNDDIWAILALEAAGESVDSDIIDFVLEWRNSDGGWGIDIYSESDVDVTAAAIMALVASGADADEPEIEDALDFLLDVQNSDGGFPEEDGGQSNAASDAWAIMAIMAADGDPNSSEWDKSGDNAVDHLLELQDTDGFFNFTDGDDVNPEWMTCYAIPALLGLPYPVPALEASSGSGDAEIEVSPAELVFYATEGGDDPLDREIVIINAGSGDMDWDVDVDESWLDVSPSSGTSDDEGETVTVSIDISGLDADDYHGTITIAADDADNSPETIDVDLYVEEATDDNVVMFYPEEFEFVGDLDEDENPADQVLEIWNSGPDAIDWDIEVDCDEGWLTVSPDNGELDEEHVSIRLRVDIEGLDPDDYDATITIVADDAENDGETIPVKSEVTGPRRRRIPRSNSAHPGFDSRPLR